MPDTRIRLRGRSHETATLRRLLAAPTSIAVIGPAGIGKTALTHEVLAPIDHLAGQCLPSLRWEPYFALQMAARSDLEGPPEDVAARLLDALDGRPLWIEDLHWAHPSTVRVLELLRDRVPVVATARTDELGETGGAWLASATAIEVAPLDPADCRQVVRDRWPGLTADSAADLVELAAGNPLLLRMLPADDGSVAAGLGEAVTTMVAALEPSVVDGLGRLSLLGRPAAPELVGTDARHPLLTTTRDGVWFRHALIADAVADIVGHRAPRLHAELADRLAGPESVQHRLAAGDVDRALSAAMAAAAVSDNDVERARLLQLAVACGDRLGRPDDGLRVDAARCLLRAQRYEEAIDIVDELRADCDPDIRIEAAFEAGRARWHAGDVQGAIETLAAAAASAATHGSPLSGAIHAELAYIRLRHRLPGAEDDAARAIEEAERTGTGVLRARALHAVTRGYRLAPGWEDILTDTMAAARSAGDVEMELVSAYHLTSGLGFTNRIAEANEILEPAAARAHEHGLITWQTLCESALMTNLALMGGRSARVLEGCDELLTRRPRFRNWPQAATARVLALTDLDRLDDARDGADALWAAASTDEDWVWATTAMAEVAWLAGDGEAAEEVLARSRSLGDSYFGQRILAEVAVAHHDLDRADRASPSRAVDVPSLAVPTLWPAFDELKAFAAVAGGDLVAAADGFTTAGGKWQQHGIPRFAARAFVAAGTCLRRAGRRGSAAARERGVEIARRHELGGHLRHWDASAQDVLSPREVEVLRLVADGLTSRAIGDRLGLADATVDAYVASARRKLGARTRHEAAAMLGP